MVSRIIPDDIDDPRERIARLDLGEKLRCTHPVYGGRLDKGRVKILKIERTMDVHAPASRGGSYGGAVFVKGVENMATAFARRGAAPEQISAAEVDKLHSKIGQLVVERDFLANASETVQNFVPWRISLRHWEAVFEHDCELAFDGVPFAH